MERQPPSRLTLFLSWCADCGVVTKGDHGPTGWRGLQIIETDSFGGVIQHSEWDGFCFVSDILDLVSKHRDTQMNTDRGENGKRQTEDPIIGEKPRRTEGPWHLHLFLFQYLTFFHFLYFTPVLTWLDYCSHTSSLLYKTFSLTQTYINHGHWDK